MFSNPNSDFKARLLAQLVSQVVPLENTKHFFADPAELFVGVCIVLRRKSLARKGILLIKYSYYFPLMFKLFDMQEVAKNYHIVLEPSWAGTCDPGILAYATLNEPVFVMSYESRDSAFINAISTGLKAVKLSSNWWVDHRKFHYDIEKKRDIDIIVISAWASFKRHYFIFKALKQLKKVRPNLTVSLVGYPGDMTMSQVQLLAQRMGVLDILTFYEWIEPEEVSCLLQRAKVNLLWSRFEGLNRSIIEGMFCNVPCILREGFNYGDKYPYINRDTGDFSSESRLPENLHNMIETYDQFAPRQYVLNNHTCLKATEILSREITRFDRDSNEQAEDVDVKINALHGMDYFHSGSRTKFNQDERFILNLLR